MASQINAQVQAALQTVSDDAVASGTALSAVQTAQTAATQAQTALTQAQGVLTQAQQQEATDLAALEALLTQTYAPTASTPTAAAPTATPAPTGASS